MRIAIGADHGGYPLNEYVIEELRSAGHEDTKAIDPRAKLLIA